MRWIGLVFVILTIISSDAQCEINYWTVLEPLLSQEPPIEAIAYTKSLSKEELLILGRQSCQTMAAQKKADHDTFVAAGLIIEMVLKVYIEKSGERLDGDIFVNIIRDKGEPSLWREQIVYWLDETIKEDPKRKFYSFFNPQDQDSLLDALESVLIDKNESAKIRTWCCKNLALLLEEEYESISQKESERVKSINERIHRIVLHLLKIAEDPTENEDVIKIAISWSCGFYRLNVPDKENIENRLLMNFSNRKVYKPEIQIELVDVLLLHMRHIELLPEVQKMHEETEDAKLKEEIEDTLKVLLSYARDEKDGAKEKRIIEVLKSFKKGGSFGVIK